MVSLNIIEIFIFGSLCLILARYGQAKQADSASDVSDSSSSSSSSSRSRSSSSSSSSSSRSRTDYSSKSYEEESTARKYSRSTRNLKIKATAYSRNENTGVIPTWSTVNEVQEVTDKCIHCICKAAGGCKPDRPVETDQNAANNLLDLDSGVGPLRITRPYWEDAGSPGVSGKDSSSFLHCANDMNCATKAVKSYMARYPFDCNGDGIVNCSDYIAIHNRGPFACQNPLPVSYQERFLNCWNGPSTEDLNKEKSESWFSRFFKRTKHPSSTAAVILEQTEQLNQKLFTTEETNTELNKIQATSELVTVTEVNESNLNDYDKLVINTEESVTRYDISLIEKQTDTYFENENHHPEVDKQTYDTTDTNTVYETTTVTENFTEKVTQEQNAEITTFIPEEYSTYTTEKNFEENTLSQQEVTGTEEMQSPLKERETSILNEITTEPFIKTANELDYKTNIENPSYVSPTETSPIYTDDYNEFTSTDKMTEIVTEETELTTNSNITYDEEITYIPQLIDNTLISFQNSNSSRKNIISENHNFDMSEKETTSSAVTSLKLNFTSDKRKIMKKKVIAPVDISPMTDDCINCICEAASDCRVGTFTDGSVYGPFRITEPYWKDAESPKVTSGNGNSSFVACANDLECSERTVRAYMSKYQFDCNGDGVVNCSDYAAIHINGPYACEKPLPNNYLTRFLRCSVEISTSTTEYKEILEEPEPEKGTLKKWFTNVMDKIAS
ncbi:uncharacterized protein LOC142318105 [Lycorma delicatula]|uniref:uncharacterized protein LOC142318105 n=1 Tax=Lycorma delicatula TaxID=130591 RepID=UPI003F51979F